MSDIGFDGTGEGAAYGDTSAVLEKDDDLDIGGEILQEDDLDNIAFGVGRAALDIRDEAKEL